MDLLSALQESSMFNGELSIPWFAFFTLLIIAFLSNKWYFKFNIHNQIPTKIVIIIITMVILLFINIALIYFCNWSINKSISFLFKEPDTQYTDKSIIITTIILNVVIFGIIDKVSSFFKKDFVRDNMLYMPWIAMVLYWGILLIFALFDSDLEFLFDDVASNLLSGMVFLIGMGVPILIVILKPMTLRSLIYTKSRKLPLRVTGKLSKDERFLYIKYTNERSEIIRIDTVPLDEITMIKEFFDSK